MKKSFISLVTILSLFSFMFAAPQAAYACSCMAPGPVEEEFDASAAVFSGTVVEFGEPTDGFRYVMFDVQESWKGVDADKVAITTPQDSAGCGFTFEEGKSYLVFADQSTDGQMSVNLCSRTHEIMPDDQDLAALGEMQLPTDPNPVAPKSNTAVIAVVALLALAVLGYALRKKRSNG